MKNASIQDRYLDLLIEAAYERQETQAVDRLLQTPDPVLTPEQTVQAAQAFQRGMDKTALLQRREKQARRRIRLKRAVLVSGRCLVYLLAACNLLLPAAYAASASFRESMLNLLIMQDADMRQMYMTSMISNLPEEAPPEEPPPDDDFFFSGPNGWMGQMFPKWIPPEYELTEVAADGLSARYGNGESGFVFAQHGKDGQSMDGIDYAPAEESEGTIYPLRIVDYEKDGKPRTGVAFSVSPYDWYELIGENMDRETLVRIMDSIFPAFRLEPVDIKNGALPSAEAEPPRAQPPSCWEGRSYPAYIPSGFHLTQYTRSMDLPTYTAVLRSSTGASIRYSEFIKDEMPENASAAISTVVTVENGTAETVTINGTEAVAANAYAEGGNNASIVWETENAMFAVTTYDLNMEETRRIAESVRLLNADELPPRWTSDQYNGEDAVPPPCWQGDYFPAILPDGYELQNYSGLDQEKITLSQQAGPGEIQLAETFGNPLPGTGVENGSAKLIVMGDTEILIVEGSSYGISSIYMYIPCGARWFALGCKNIGMEDALHIAESLRRIRPEENAALPTIPTAVPASWAGAACLSALPEGMELQAENTSPDLLLWRDGAGRIIRLRYFTAPVEMPLSAKNYRLHGFSVNGCTAYQFFAHSFGTSYVSFLWRDADGWYILDTERLSTEEAEQVAGWVRPIRAEERIL